jgi:hypothetical protein
MSDGVNDARSYTRLSVEGAVDVAREAADFVLLERQLDVIGPVLSSRRLNPEYPSSTSLGSWRGNP